MAPPRGRRPGTPGAKSDTRELIATTARRQFAELGYPHTTLRTIAREAGVDTRLVGHYFGSKHALFIEVVELPFDPGSVYEQLAAEGPGLGLRLARFVLSVLDSPEGRQTMTGLMRAAASEEEAARLVRDLLVERMMLPLVRQLGGSDPELRASLLGAQIAGLAFARHIVGIPALVAADSSALAAAIAPVLEHYLNGPVASSTT